MRRDQALEVVAGQAPVDAVTERRGRSIKISPDQGAPYAALAVVGQARRPPKGVPSFLAMRRASSITRQAGRRRNPGGFKDLADVLPAESRPATGAHQ